MSDGFQWPPGDTHFAAHGPWQNYQKKNRAAALALAEENWLAKDDPPYMGVDLGLMLDIGAHAGSWTFDLARHFQYIIAFEPLHWHTWEQNKQALGCENCEIRPWALSNKKSWVEIDRRSDNTGDCSLKTRPGQYHLEKIPAQRGDDQYYYDWGIDLIKIDVQGWEFQTLQGLENTIKTHTPTLCVELNDGDSFSEILLTSWGYTLAKRMGKDWIWQPTSSLL